MKITTDIKVDDLYKIHNVEAVKDTYLITNTTTDGKNKDVQKILLGSKQELKTLYEKIGAVLKND